MRILDKNKDYYDYLQCYEDDLVYDRRGSYILTNKDICDIWDGWHKFNSEFENKHLLLHIGYSFWLIDVICLSSVEENGWKVCTDYSLELIDYWKDYNHFDKLHFGTVKKNYSIEYLYSKKWDWKSKLVDDIKHGNYEYIKDFTNSHHHCHSNTEKEFTELIFSKTKIPSIIKAEDLYNAFDEYYSHLKDDIKVDNMSDIEKVESHGFDKKTSFRGKN